MLLAPHALVGAAIAATVPNPILGLLLAFLSHFLLDRVPHWEYSIEPLKNIKSKGILYCLPILRRVFADLFIGGILIIASSAIGGEFSPVTFIGGFFGILPDGMTALYILRPKNKFLKIFFTLHQGVHFSKEHGRPPLRVGLTWQIVASVLALYFLVF